MSYELITEGFNKIQEVKSWATILIKYNHKTNPNEFTCYKFQFESEKLLVDTINDMYKTFINTAKKQSGGVKEYTAFNSKDTVEKINIQDELIKDNWIALMNSLTQCDDTTRLEEIKVSAFIFIGTYHEDSVDKNLYIISKKNPILSYKKKVFSLTRQNRIASIDNPIIQFNKTFDAVVYQNILYTLNLNFEFIFNLENSHRKKCKECLAHLAEQNIIKNYEAFEQQALKYNNVRKFKNYSYSVILELQNETFKNFLINKLGIPYDENEQVFDLSTSTAQHKFISVICDKAKRNIHNEDIVEVTNVSSFHATTIS